MADPQHELGYEPPPEEQGWDRTPPHNLLAEQATVGGMLLSKTAIDDVTEVMRPADFYIPKHEVIADAILALAGRDEPTDALAVIHELEQTGHLARAGGAEYLHTLTGIPSTAANAGYYAEIVADFAVRRRLIEGGTRIVQMGYASEGRTDELVSNAQAEVDEVMSAKRQSVRMIGATLGETFAGLADPPVYMPSPWASIDKMIGGFAPGSFYVIAARPGEGKTNWVLQAAAKAARVGLVAFSSLEMTEQELQVRLLSQFGDVSMTSLRRHTLSDDEWNRAARAKDVLLKAPIFIDESEQATVGTVAAHARAVSRKGKLAAVFVDYLQLIDGEGQDRRVVVDNIAKGLKQLAKRMQVPVIAAAQLNRGERGRGRERPLPTLRDLREAGGIEANADVVLLLHRDVERRPADLKVIAAKNRHGTTGVVTLHWQGEFSRTLDKRWSPTALFDEVE